MARASVRIDLPNLAATEGLAGALARIARRRDVFALEGDLGAGKTAFARAFIRARGGAEEVPSPTFTLVQVYEFADGPVHHFDLYRLCAPEEAWELDIEDAFADGISLIEWPDRAEGLLPNDRLNVRLAHAGGDARACELDGGGDWGTRLGEARLDG